MGKGKLVFKGDKPKKKKKVSKHSSSHENEQTATIIGIPKNPDNDTKLTNNDESEVTTASAPIPPTQIVTGLGKITSSGTVLTGYDTKFTKSIQAGDAILAPIGGKDEMRVITMRLSDTSAAISSAFSTDLKTPTSFQYISKPRNIRQEKIEKEKKEKLSRKELEQSAFGTYSSQSGGTGKHELVYRERTEHGSYRIRKEVLDDSQQDISRSDLLTMRSKKKSDRYC